MKITFKLLFVFVVAITANINLAHASDNVICSKDNLSECISGTIIFIPVSPENDTTSKVMATLCNFDKTITTSVVVVDRRSQIKVVCVRK